LATYPLACSLFDFEYRPSLGFARFIFKGLSDNGYAEAVCRGVMLFKVSNEVGEMIPPFNIDLYLAELHGPSALAIMKSRGYGCAGVGFPETIFHLRAEGDSVIHVFCTDEIEITEH
jgi:hypothetical protein